MNELISIIIPVFNVAQYLDRCLNSVTRQTYKNLEIVIIDDGSTDDSGKICDIWGEKDNRIKVIHQRNKGVAAARNYAISVAKGDYIGFVDSDDYVDEDMFEILLSTAARFAADIVICGFKEVKGGVARTKQVQYTRFYTRDEALYELIKDENVQSYLWNKLFRRKSVPDNPFPEIKRISDLAGMHKFFQKADAIVQINRSCYCYCRRAESLVDVHGASLETSVYHCLAMQLRYEDLYLEDEKIRMFAAEKYINWIEQRIKKKIIDILHSCDDTNAALIKNHIAPFYSSHVKDFRNFVKGFTPVKERELCLFLNNPITFSNPNEYAFLNKDCAPDISVIMPVYNAGRFLPFALDSLKQQTFLNFEVICVNDGSTDYSLEVLKEYAKKDCRIHIINNTSNLRAGVSRNIAMKEARGKYITFLDADDAFPKDALEQFYIKGIETDADCIICQNYNSKGILEYTLRSHYLPSVECFSPTDITDYIFNFTHAGPNGKCVKRSLIEKENIKYSTLARSEDILFVYKTLIKSKKISVIEKPLYQKNVVLNENSLEHTKHETPLIFWDAIIEVNTMLREEGVFEKFKRSIINANVERCLYNVNMLKRSSGYNSLKVKKLFCDTGIDKKIIKELELYDHETDYFSVPGYPELLQFLEKTYEEYANDFVDYAAEQEEQLKKVQCELKELMKLQKHYAKYSTLRVDIRNRGNENNNVIEQTVSPEPFSLKRPCWLKNGITIESEAESMVTVLQCQGDGELEVALMGRDVRNANGVRYPVWIDCIYFAVNGEMVFNETKTVCHDKRYIYRKAVKDGEEILLEMAWSECQSPNVLDEYRQLQSNLKQANDKVRVTETALKIAKSEKQYLDLVTLIKETEKKSAQQIPVLSDLMKQMDEKNVKQIQNLAKQMEELREENNAYKLKLTNIEETIRRLQRNVRSCERYASETVWAEVFNNVISDSPWLKNTAFSAGRWAVGYQYLYVMYRVLNEIHPRHILELGLGQSTRMISQYASSHEQVEHFVVEDDPEWIDFFSRDFTLCNLSKIIKLDCEMIPFKEAEAARVFKGFEEQFNGRKFDFISIDAPVGYDMTQYARIDVLKMLPGCLADSFIIMIDDTERTGETNMVNAIKEQLKQSGIAFAVGRYSGKKDCTVICSNNLRFVCSM